MTEPLEELEARGYRAWPRSPIWTLQRSYYARAGVEAWRTGEVPHYVTSHPPFAHAYAQVALACLGDLRGGAGLTWSGEPVTILELGAGHARFSFHFLTRFLELHQRSRLRRVPFRVVLADISEANVEAWQRHPRLVPLVEAGLLDFARFDAELDDELVLTCSRARIGPRSLATPLIVFANYFFDVLRQDVLRITPERTLERGVVRVAREDGTLLDAYDPDEGAVPLDLSYAHAAIDGPPYGRRAWDALAAEYARTLEPRSVLMPVAGLDLLERLERLSRVGLVLLAADRGSDRLEDLPRHAPGFGLHGGSFSLPVNFHALAHVRAQQGDTVLQHRGPSLHYFCCVSPPLAREMDGIRHAFETFVERLDPNDFHLQSTLLRTAERISPDVVLASLPLSQWDAEVFSAISAVLARHLPELPWRARAPWRHALQQVWRYYFPLGEDNDVAFQLGVVAASLGFFRDALGYYESSARHVGPDAATFHNAGLCHCRLGELDEAEVLLEQALARGGSERTVALLEEVRAWRARRADQAWFHALPEPWREDADPLGVAHAERIAEAVREAPEGWLAEQIGEGDEPLPARISAWLRGAEHLLAHLDSEVGLVAISELVEDGPPVRRWALLGT